MCINPERRGCLDTKITPTGSPTIEKRAEWLGITNNPNRVIHKASMK
jgi:hypothetical protein